MRRPAFFLVLGLCLVTAIAVTNKPVIGEGTTMEFEEAAIVFETNVTDGDVEVVFAAQAGDEGMNRFKVVGPDGNTSFEVSVPMPNALGLRQFTLETPEPQDDGSLRAAFPEGEYTFTAESVSGARFKSDVHLSHELPKVVQFKTPAEDAEDVPVQGLVVQWSAVPGVEAILLEIEQEDSGVTLLVRLPGDADSFSVPEGFLTADTEYTLSIGTVADGGNSSFVETGFATAD